MVSLIFPAFVSLTILEFHFWEVHSFWVHFFHVLVIPLGYSLVSVFGQMIVRIRNNSVIHSEGCQLFLKVATFKRIKITLMGNKFLFSPMDRRNCGLSGASA